MEKEKSRIKYLPNRADISLTMQHARTPCEVDEDDKSTIFISIEVTAILAVPHALVRRGVVCPLPVAFYFFLSPSLSHCTRTPHMCLLGDLLYSRRNSCVYFYHYLFININTIITKRVAVRRMQVMSCIYIRCSMSRSLFSSSMHLCTAHLLQYNTTNCVRDI